MNALNDLGLTGSSHACNCGGHDTGTQLSGSDAIEETSSAVREHFLVTGMTCAHCVSSVTEEISAVEGVDSVSIRLNVGGASEVMVVSSGPVALESINAAIAEAGYEVVTVKP